MHVVSGSYSFQSSQHLFKMLVMQKDLMLGDNERSNPAILHNLKKYIKNRVYIVCRNILSTTCTHDLLLVFLYAFRYCISKGIVINCQYCCYLLIYSKSFFGKSRLRTTARRKTTATQLSAKTVRTISGKMLNMPVAWVKPRPTLSERLTMIILR